MAFPNISPLLLSARNSRTPGYDAFPGSRLLLSSGYYLFLSGCTLRFFTFGARCLLLRPLPITGYLIVAQNSTWCFGCVIEISHSACYERADHVLQRVNCLDACHVLIMRIFCNGCVILINTPNYFFFSFTRYLYSLLWLSPKISKRIACRAALFSTKILMHTVQNKMWMKAHNSKFADAVGGRRDFQKINKIMKIVNRNLTKQ